MAWSRAKRHVLADDGCAPGAGACPPGRAGRCAPPASTGPSPGPGSPGSIASADTGRASPSSAFVSTSVRTVSSRKNGFPRFTRSCLSGARPGSSPRSASSRSPALSTRERVQPQLTVGCLATPAVLVLGPVVHEEQQAGRAQALDEAVEEGLSLAVDPVEILDDQEEGLLSRFSQQQPPHGVERALATLPRVERAATRRRPRARRAAASSAGSVGFKPAVEGEQLARHLLADLA